MKTLTSIVGIFLILSIVGCRENLVNPPEPSKNLELYKINEADAPYSHLMQKGVIDIFQEVIDPLLGSCRVEGQAMYYQDIRTYNVGLNKIFLNIEMNSELTTPLMNHARYSIKGKSLDTVIVSEEGIYILEKNYPISGRPDLRLGVQYLVTTEGVGIARIVLLPIDT